MKTDKYDGLRIILAFMMLEEKNSKTLGDTAENIEKHLAKIINFFKLYPE